MIGDDRMGAKVKTPQKSLWVPTKTKKISAPKINHQKKSHVEFSSLKKFPESKTSSVVLVVFAELSRPGYAGTTTNLQVVFTTPKKSPLK